MKRFDFKTLGKALKHKRLVKQAERGEKISLRNLSSELGISTPTLSRAENGKAIDIDNVLNICDWAGLKFEAFILTV